MTHSFAVTETRNARVTGGRRCASLLVAMLTVALFSTAIPAVASPTEGAIAKELERDVILRAMVDELQRGIEGLKLEAMARPYFIEFAVRDARSGYVSAELGAVTRRNESPGRGLRVDVRIGSYELDNTNYGSSGGGGGAGNVAMPVEDDYNAIRQALWWATDRDYKQVVEDFERKKAFMETKIIEDKPDDHSRETHVVHFDERLAPSLPMDELERIAVELSGVFRDYPEIQQSRVRIAAAAGNKYLVNTEGTRLRTARTSYQIAAGATVQAEDGMKLSDSLNVCFVQVQDMPSLEELTRRCREMAERLIRIKHAPKIEDAYTGPVLFDAEAATSIFSQNFGGRFAGGQRPVGSRASPDDFEKKLNQRILPKIVNVVDDPTLETIAGSPVLGHYRYDDEGVPARPVSLVENGKLKALVMSRNPSKEFKNSTGHGRGIYRPSAGIGCLVLSATDPDHASDAAALRALLLEACDD